MCYLSQWTHDRILFLTVRGSVCLLHHVRFVHAVYSVNPVCLVEKGQWKLINIIRFNHTGKFHVSIRNLNPEKQKDLSLTIKCILIFWVNLRAESILKGDYSATIQHYTHTLKCKQYLWESIESEDAHAPLSVRFVDSQFIVCNSEIRRCRRVTLCLPVLRLVLDAANWILMKLQRTACISFNITTVWPEGNSTTHFWLLVHHRQRVRCR